jgi:hypothetical protein
VLGEVEETVYQVTDDEDDESVTTIKKSSEMLFVRGIYIHTAKEGRCRDAEMLTWWCLPHR